MLGRLVRLHQLDFRGIFAQQLADSSTVLDQLARVTAMLKGIPVTHLGAAA
jgi:hypothetical protein